MLLAQKHAQSIQQSENVYENHMHTSLAARKLLLFPPQYVFSAQTRGLDIPGDIGYASLDVNGDVSCDAGVREMGQNSHWVGAAAMDVLMGIARGLSPG